MAAPGSIDGDEPLWLPVAAIDPEDRDWGVNDTKYQLGEGKMESLL